MNKYKLGEYKMGINKLLDNIGGIGKILLLLLKGEYVGKNYNNLVLFCYDTFEGGKSGSKY